MSKEDAMRKAKKEARGKLARLKGFQRGDQMRDFIVAQLSFAMGLILYGPFLTRRAAKDYAQKVELTNWDVRQLQGGPEDQVDPRRPNFVKINGQPDQGWSVYGPFGSKEEAVEYPATENLGAASRAIQLDTPDCAFPHIIRYQKDGKDYYIGPFHDRVEAQCYKRNVVDRMRRSVKVKKSPELYIHTLRRHACGPAKEFGDCAIALGHPSNGWVFYGAYNQNEDDIDQGLNYIEDSAGGDFKAFAVNLRNPEDFNLVREFVEDKNEN